MPDECKKLNYPIPSNGGWMSSLLDELRFDKNVEIAVSTGHPNIEDSSFIINRIKYYIMKESNSISWKHFDKIMLIKCKEVINDFKPDIIHIHGTEKYYGLIFANKMTNVPGIINLQGITSQLKKYVFCNMSIVKLWQSTRFDELIRLRGPIGIYLDLKKRAKREIIICSALNNVIGRTNWDFAHIKMINKGINYYHVEEMLRQEFYQSIWNLKDAIRHQIVFTNAHSILKNIEILFSTLLILKKDYPDICLLLAGSIRDDQSGYGIYLKKKIIKMGLSSYVKLIGKQDCLGIIKALLSSHVFINPSLIDNSPNTLCEAMIVGMPSISSYTGGITSLIEDGNTGLFFPPQDAPLLASAVQRIFNDDKFAQYLGNRARQIALKRHDPKNIVSSMISIYEELM